MKLKLHRKQDTSPLCPSHYLDLDTFISTKSGLLANQLVLSACRNSRAASRRLMAFKLQFGIKFQFITLAPKFFLQMTESYTGIKNSTQLSKNNPKFILLCDNSSVMRIHRKEIFPVQYVLNSKQLMSRVPWCPCDTEYKSHHRKKLVQSLESQRTCFMLML